MLFDPTAISSLGEADSVVLYPSIAHPLIDQNQWAVHVHGCVFEQVPLNFSRRFLVRLLARIMRATPSQIQSEVFLKHINGFVVRQHGGKQIAIKLGEKIFRLPKKTKKSGQFFGKLILAESEFYQLIQTSVDGKTIPYSIVSEVGNAITGEIQCLNARGISIISDIDDTIKHTEVSSKRLMLQNTFLKEFQPIQGMPELYQDWQSQGADFHYVTSSPWQLYDVLLRLFQKEGIPAGSFHMKSIRFRDPTILRLFIARRMGKRRMIKQLFKTFPERQFILVGDSGEKDPETYGIMARRFPDQIQGIYIRNLNGKNCHESRFMRAFRSIPREKWQLFDHADEIPRELSTPKTLNPSS